MMHNTMRKRKEDQRRIQNNRHWRLVATWIAVLLVVCLEFRPVSAGFIDMDTPLDKRTTASLVDGSVYHLVMSDEFNVPNRTFKDGHDPVWTALDKSDDDSSAAGGGSQQFYNSSMCGTTKNGTLSIDTSTGKTSWVRYNHIKKKWHAENAYFKSGMMQSWNKFCFTGGIVEVDLVFPGNPFIGGLWPAVWMLGNLGRATYEASTNNIWPWSYNTCDYSMQRRQAISACNSQNHYGLHPHQGRGATEIDIVEVMTGDSKGFFKQTSPGVALPYADMTLQVAPGIEKNRPQSGSLPSPNETKVHGFTQFKGQQWYPNLEYHGNTSINPFFYGTYLGETKPEEPVTRTKKEAFQADAVGVVHQLTPSHFQKMHTLRLEWQPGPGGRLDWFAKGYKKTKGDETYYTTGDGDGPDWVPVFTLKDEALREVVGAQIPNEPTYLIMNTAISSTWGFPYDVPDWCTKCYDCDDPKCACAFHAGFCQTLRDGVSMQIDSIRVYQSRDGSAHVGANHTVGCDPPDYPTKEFIQGHEYRYMRNPPFSYEDKHPLRPIQKGGGPCKTDTDCGGNLDRLNLTRIYEELLNGDADPAAGADPDISTAAAMKEKHSRALKHAAAAAEKGMGKCLEAKQMPALLTGAARSPKVCQCFDGYTGPHCRAQAHFDDTLSATELRALQSPFRAVVSFSAPGFLLFAMGTLVVIICFVVVYFVRQEKHGPSVIKGEYSKLETPALKRPVFMGHDNDQVISGTSI